MTAKRFEFELDMNITDNLTDKEYDLHTDETFEFIKLINRLHMENNRLKKENNDLQRKASGWKITASKEIMEKGELMKQIEKLKSENEMLKFTIARNESYIDRITHKGEWNNCSGELFPKSLFDKCVIGEEEWRNLKCKECGGEMEVSKDNRFESVKVCRDCGYKLFLLKKI